MLHHHLQESLRRSSGLLEAERALRRATLHRSADSRLNHLLKNKAAAAHALADEIYRLARREAAAAPAGLVQSVQSSVQGVQSSVQSVQSTRSLLQPAGASSDGMALLMQKASEQLGLMRSMIEWSHERELFVQIESGIYHSVGQHGQSAVFERPQLAATGSSCCI